MTYPLPRAACRASREVSALRMAALRQPKSVRAVTHRIVDRLVEFRPEKGTSSAAFYMPNSFGTRPLDFLTTVHTLRRYAAERLLLDWQLSAETLFRRNLVGHCESVYAFAQPIDGSPPLQVRIMCHTPRDPADSTQAFYHWLGPQRTHASLVFDALTRCDCYGHPLWGQSVT